MLGAAHEGGDHIAERRLAADDLVCPIVEADLIREAPQESIIDTEDQSSLVCPIGQNGSFGRFRQQGGDFTHALASLQLGDPFRQARGVRITRQCCAEQILDEVCGIAPRCRSKNSGLERKTSAMTPSDIPSPSPQSNKTSLHRRVHAERATDRDDGSKGLQALEARLHRQGCRLLKNHGANRHQACRTRRCRQRCREFACPIRRPVAIWCRTVQIDRPRMVARVDRPEIRIPNNGIKMRERAVGVSPVPEEAGARLRDRKSTSSEYAVEAFGVAIDVNVDEGVVGCPADIQRDAQSLRGAGRLDLDVAPIERQLSLWRMACFAHGSEGRGVDEFDIPNTGPRIVDHDSLAEVASQLRHDRNAVGSKIGLCIGRKDGAALRFAVCHNNRAEPGEPFSHSTDMVM